MQEKKKSRKNKHKTGNGSDHADLSNGNAVPSERQ